MRTSSGGTSTNSTNWSRYTWHYNTYTSYFSPEISNFDDVEESCLYPGDYVRLKSIEELQSIYFLSRRQRTLIEHNQGIIYKVKHVEGKAVTLDKKMIREYELYGHRSNFSFNKKSFEKVSRKEALKSRIDLPEYLFEI